MFLPTGYEGKIWGGLCKDPIIRHQSTVFQHHWGMFTHSLSLCSHICTHPPTLCVQCHIVCASKPTNWLVSWELCKYSLIECIDKTCVEKGYVCRRCDMRIFLLGHYTSSYGLVWTHKACECPSCASYKIGTAMYYTRKLQRSVTCVTHTICTWYLCGLLYITANTKGDSCSYIDDYIDLDYIIAACVVSCSRVVVERVVLCGSHTARVTNVCWEPTMFQQGMYGVLSAS